MKNPTAAIIIIGNEILSGRTLDINTQAIATTLGEIGVEIIETRTIADDKSMIVKTVRELTNQYDYIFTTGGIGPTHDDITAISIAEAFNLPYTRNEEIYNIMKQHYGNTTQGINAAREKMAYIPESAKLLYSDATIIPAFITKNVFSLAGIPKTMQSMLNSAIPMLKKGDIIKSQSIKIMLGENIIAKLLTILQNKYKNVDIGSYPFIKNKKHGTNLVLRSADYKNLDKSVQELRKSLNQITQEDLT